MFGMLTLGTGVRAELEARGRGAELRRLEHLGGEVFVWDGRRDDPDLVEAFEADPEACGFRIEEVSGPFSVVALGANYHDSLPHGEVIVTMAEVAENEGRVIDRRDL
jgi:hypothetical protein